ncbi:hypothetical protein B4Q13_22405, partial [Lacticaseibacillus rhamnosus]
MNGTMSEAFRIRSDATDHPVIQTISKTPGAAPVQAVYGSSGNFYSQLLNRAPFDLFLSADMQYPKRLAEQGLVLEGSEFKYARGRLAIWTERE